MQSKMLERQYVAVEGLVAAIIVQAAKDWENDHFRSEVVEFSQSQQFAEFAEFVGLRADLAARKLAKGNLQKPPLKSAYHSRKEG